MSIKRRAMHNQGKNQRPSQIKQHTLFVKSGGKIVDLQRFHTLSIVSENRNSMSIMVFNPFFLKFFLCVFVSCEHQIWRTVKAYLFFGICHTQTQRHSPIHTHPHTHTPTYPQTHVKYV